MFPGTGHNHNLRGSANPQRADQGPHQNSHTHQETVVPKKVVVVYLGGARLTASRARRNHLCI